MLLVIDMKKNLLFIITILFILGVSILLFNPTFIKGSYKGIKIPLFTYYHNNNLYSIRSYNGLNKSINKYLNSLEKCNDYYYDKELNKSIITYNISNNKFIKKINIEYENDNVCKYISNLDKDWYKSLDNLNLIGYDYTNCIDNNCKTSNKLINIDKFINTIKNSKLYNNEYIDLEYKDNNKYISIYYSDNSTYSISIKLFKYSNNTLGVLYIENNNTKKLGTYKLKNDINKYIESLVM